VVERLFPALRPGASYSQSLKLLKKAKQINPDIATKSGIIIGFGETKQEIIATIKDLRAAGCDYLSIGQYLSPSKNHTPVNKYYLPEEFAQLKTIATKMGFQHVESGALVRSSYMAHKYQN